MTVSSLVPVNNYTGNGSTCQFDFDFLIEDEKELVVTLMNKKENTTEQLIFGVDYLINEIGAKNGSFIVYPLEEISSHDVLSPDEVLTLSLDLSIKQESEFENSATLKLDVLEWTFDYIVRVLQILSRKIDRSVKIVEGESTKPEELVRNLFDAEFNSKSYSKAAYQNLEEIKQMKIKIDSDMKMLDKELKDVVHKSNEEEITGVKNFTNEILYKGQNIFDVVSQDYETAIKDKQDLLIAGDNIVIENNVISAQGGFNLFDTKLSDHILDGDELKGWALQGTYVYKNAIAGSRDGYPDFYNKVIEEYNEAILTETVNGVTVKVNSNGHKFYDIADKTIIDELFNNTGLAWFYGVDTANERVFLPRNAWFEQMTADTLEVGDSVEAGLPNITGLLKIAINEYSVSGAFTASAGGGKESANGDDSQSTNFNFDASLSNLIYGNSDTVQPNAVKKLLYICVGNTNVETAVTEVVDVTTTENDTIPLFTGQYFDFTPNNLSWLKGGEQVNSGDIYTTAYNELVNCLNGVNKYNLKVINMADMLADVDYSEYWKVNQDEMYFITPTKLSYGALTGGVLGNGMTLGVTNGTENYGLMTDTRNSYSTPSLSLTAYGTEIGTRADNDRPVVALTYGITQDVTKSGIIAEESTTVQLYFKVANAVQNLELLNVGEVMEAMTDKISRQDCVAYITESFVDGTSGYNVYSNGYCEQWGTYGTESQTGVDSNQTITLLKPYKDANYSVMCTHQFANSTYNSNAHIYSKTNTNFVFTTQKGINYWQTKGYIS